MRIGISAVVVIALFAGAARADEELDKAREQVAALEKEKARVEKELAAAKARLESLEKKAGAADPDAAVRKKLAAQKLTLNFADTPLEEVVAFLQDLTGLNVVIARPRDTKIVLRLKDVTVSNALDLICAAGDDVAWELRGGIIWFVSKRSPPPAPQKVDVPADLRAGLDKKVTFNFDETPLEEVAAFLHDLGVANVTLTATARAKQAKVSLRLRDVTAATALDAVARVNGIVWRAESGAIVIDAP